MHDARLLREHARLLRVTGYRLPPHVSRFRTRGAQSGKSGCSGSRHYALSRANVTLGQFAVHMGPWVLLY